jgi:hypothetical protein
MLYSVVTQQEVGGREAYEVVLHGALLGSPIPSVAHLFFFFFFFLLQGGLNSRLHICKAGTLPFEPYLQSILLCFVFENGFL